VELEVKADLAAQVDLQLMENLERMQKTEVPVSRGILACQGARETFKG
jgi:hypothetical protein